LQTVWQPSLSLISFWPADNSQTVPARSSLRQREWLAGAPRLCSLSRCHSGVSACHHLPTEPHASQLPNRPPFALPMKMFSLDRLTAFSLTDMSFGARGSRHQVKSGGCSGIIFLTVVLVTNHQWPALVATIPSLCHTLQWQNTMKGYKGLFFPPSLLQCEDKQIRSKTGKPDMIQSQSNLFLLYITNSRHFYNQGCF